MSRSPCRKALRGALLCVAVLASVIVATPVGAQTPPPTTGARPRTPFVEVRLALSVPAAERFAQQRFRRLLAIELEDSGHLAAQSTGPLGEQVAFVWIDLAKNDLVTIQTRFGHRATAQRTLAIGNMRGDVAERLVALATAEMVRAQSRPERPRKAVCPKEDNNHNDLPGEARLGVVWSGELAGVWMPSSPTYVAGPGGAVGFQAGPIEQHLFARWLIGDGDTGTVRWLETGLGARHLALSRPSWRLSVGMSTAAAMVRIVGARSVAGDAGNEDAWSARVAASAMVERRLASNAWLGLSLEPGLILHGVPYETGATSGDLEGAWMGMSLSLTVEHGLRRNGHPR